MSLPVLILGLSTAYSVISADRQEKLVKADKDRQEIVVREQRDGEVVTNFIKEMQPLLVDKGLRSSAPGSEVRGIARGLTLAALSQVKDSQRKRLVVRFLLDSGLNVKPGNLISLSEANLNGADLNGANLSGADLLDADLRGADLIGANLIRADLFRADLNGAILIRADLNGAILIRADFIGANLSGADLYKANLSGADLSGADLFDADLRGTNLNGANLEGVKWDEKTSWPSADRFEGAKNIPEALKKQLGPP